MPLERTYEVKGSILGIRPPVWRRLRIHGDVTLGDFHDILQAVMGWRRRHLHQFEFEGRLYAEKHPEFPRVYLDERKARLDDLLRAPKDRLNYEYDLGDGWLHAVVLEKVHGRHPDDPLCEVLAGKRACPPEDCGGPAGYNRLIEILEDEQDPEHDEMKKWVGAFEPEAFDVDLVDRSVRRRFPKGRFKPKRPSPGKRPH